MSIYVQLRCDGAECMQTVGQSGHGPTTVGLVLTRVLKTAREHGWERVRNVGWRCEACTYVARAPNVVNLKQKRN